MFQENVLLAEYSNYKIGGTARYFFTPYTTAQAQEAIVQAHKQELPIFILGGGTNLLINDSGFNGLVLHIGITNMVKEGATHIRVGAGVLMKDLVQFCIDNELAGVEWAGGLPGTVGGAIWGNAGAFGGEMKDSVTRVISVNMEPVPEIIERTNAQCEFGYRNSIFKVNAQKGVNEVITEIIFEFTVGDRQAIRKVAESHIAYRREKQPLEYPNVGSIFKNTDIKKVPAEVAKRFEAKIKTDPFPVLPTAVLIDSAGLKGRTIGGAQISEKHPNFIINKTGKASAQDVKELMEIIKNEVKKQFGVELEQEVIFV